MNYEAGPLRLLTPTNVSIFKFGVYTNQSMWAEWSREWSRERSGSYSSVSAFLQIPLRSLGPLGVARSLNPEFPEHQS
ncbi:MAG: hypothetical protein ACRDCF_01345 [Mycoplasmoidaceae bacterium]